MTVSFTLYPTLPYREGGGFLRRSFLPWLLAGVVLLTGCGLPVAADVPSAVAPSAPARPIESIAPLGPDALGYNSDATGNYEIYVTDTTGKVAKQLTSDARFDSMWPRISPDRRSILFYRAPKGKRDLDVTLYSLWLMDADGLSQREIRPKGTDGWVAQANAQWSPDGRQIVMTGGNGKDAQIYVTDANGRNARAITQRPGLNIDPSWSPDGRTVVFVSCIPAAVCTEKEVEIFAVPAAGGAATRLSHNTVKDHDPQFSPDGKLIAWEAETDPNAFGKSLGSWDIFVMNADGTNERKITPGGNINTMPQWSPDGRFIYFARYEVGKKDVWGIYRMRPDGSGLEEVTSGLPGNLGYPTLPPVSAGG
jgi:Tol biopolymer transport system component